MSEIKNKNVSSFIVLRFFLPKKSTSIFIKKMIFLLNKKT